MKLLKGKSWLFILMAFLVALNSIFLYGNDNFARKTVFLVEQEKEKKRYESSNQLEILGRLPWEDDTEFLEALKKHDNPPLIAQFKAVLNNPFLGELSNVELAASMLKGTVLNPGETFSQNGRLGPYTREKGYRAGPMFVGAQVTESVGGGVCKIASLLYNVATLANLEIIERHYHSMPVPYVPLGQDATVAYGFKDFKFKNNTTVPIFVWAGTVGNTAYMALYGKIIPPKVSWHHAKLQEIPFKTLYKEDSTLPKGTEKLLVKGMAGALVETTLVIQYSDGNVEIRELGRSWYNPMPEVIARGTAQ